MPEQFDILIAGAGFAGSIAALVLNDMGFKVCVVEKGKHPRFAIGESSTPVADMILRHLSAKHNLPWLKDFSRYGSWQQAHPEIVCGIKRGFSYFKHYPGEEFHTDEQHGNELLVAASVSDTQSDANWLRSDFDGYVAGKVKEAGITYYDLTDITCAERNGHWTFFVNRDKAQFKLQASFFMDATGSGNLLQKIACIPSQAESFQTNSFGVFSHFNNVPRWVDILQSKHIPANDFPYDPDNSALHQVLDEGWIWMLRFNTGLISIGFALDGHDDKFTAMSANEIWQYMINRYPSVNEMIGDAVLADVPGSIIKSGRLQRRLLNCFGDGWAALPHTCGFVDPLFSSGIAHSLTGIEKLTALLQETWNDKTLMQQQLKQYETVVFAELEMTDMLVAGCYKTMRHFKLFTIWSMLYFTATIAYEQRRLKGKTPGYFLSADNAYVKQIVQQSYEDLKAILAKGTPAEADILQFSVTVQQRIAPLNTAGLMDPASRNMYKHTTANL